MTELYVGLMSGTSADGIDAALVDFSQPQPRVIATHYAPYSETLRNKVLALCQQGEDEIRRLGELDVELGKAFASATHTLLQQQALSSTAVRAIGSHGQTIRHHPHLPYSFTLQIGDPNTIAAETGITTIADFRRKDMAFGGQGAPLVPAFHQHLFASTTTNRIIVNIGGIANITLLQKNHSTVIGFDTGPGNALMDAWIHLHKKAKHDAKGGWAAQGTMDPLLLSNLLADNYFDLPPPKSTGREYFSLSWLKDRMEILGKKIAPADVQTTLVELTAHSILHAIRKHVVSGEILVCGGGAHNEFLLSRLTALAGSDFMLATTAKYSIDPDWIEAMAFAWLAKQTFNRTTGNLPSVTGAKKAAILGGIYFI